MSVLTHVVIASLILHISVSDNAGDARIVEWINERYPDGGYFFRYVTSDGIVREESGTLEAENGKEILRVKGYFSYMDADGFTEKKEYEADENGSKPFVSSAWSPPAPAPAPAPAPIPTSAIITLIGGGLR